MMGYQCERKKGGMFGKERGKRSNQMKKAFCRKQYDGKEAQCDENRAKYEGEKTQYEGKSIRRKRTKNVERLSMMKMGSEQYEGIEAQYKRRWTLYKGDGCIAEGKQIKWGGMKQNYARRIRIEQHCNLYIRNKYGM